MSVTNSINHMRILPFLFPFLIFVAAIALIIEAVKTVARYAEYINRNFNPNYIVPEYRLPSNRKVDYFLF